MNAPMVENFGDMVDAIGVFGGSQHEVIVLASFKSNPKPTNFFD